MPTITTHPQYQEMRELRAQARADFAASGCIGDKMRVNDRWRIWECPNQCFDGERGHLEFVSKGERAPAECEDCRDYRREHGDG